MGEGRKIHLDLTSFETQSLIVAIQNRDINYCNREGTYRRILELIEKQTKAVGYDNFGSYF